MGYYKNISGFGVFLVLMELVSLSMAYKFFVGGKDGWVLKPSESFDHWAQRNRFQVNDTLLFKYKQGSESVLEVSKEDYDSCNTSNPITALTGGDSVFLLNRSGPFFFIAGTAEKCWNGQKLHLVVMAVRHKTHQGSSSTSSAPAQSPAVPEQRFDPSVLDDAPSPAPGKNHSDALKWFGGSGLGMFLFVIFLYSFVGLVY